jgi:hypothetical protein
MMSRGLADDNADPLTTGGQFVQWAETGAGSAGNSMSWDDRSAQVRYNLNQFWSLKNANYNDDPNAWDKLDLRAHKAWAALAELGMVSDNPPAQAKYQSEAQQAYLGAIAASERLGKDTTVLQMNAGNSENWYGEVKSLGNSIDDRLTVALKDRVNVLLDEANSILGLPLWAWGIGAAAVLWLLYGRR